METQEKDDHFIDLVLKEDLIKRIFYIYEQVSKNSGMYSIDAEIYMAELSLLEFKRSNNSKSMTENFFLDKLFHLISEKISR